MYPKSRTGAKIAHHPAARLLQDEPGAGWYTLRFDGACDGNGRADASGRWAYQLLDPSCRTAGVRSGPAVGCPVTNNVAEWQGLVEGLRHAATVVTGGGLLVEGDSDLVVSQLSGRWSAKDEFLAEHLADALELLVEIGRPWAARWIDREENEFCDSLTRGGL